MVLHRVWAIRRFLAKVYGGGQYREGKALNFLIHQATVSPLRRCCYPVRAVHSMRNEALNNRIMACNGRSFQRSERLRDSHGISLETLPSLFYAILLPFLGRFFCTPCEPCVTLSCIANRSVACSLSHAEGCTKITEDV
jgi:hypothetical protein